MKKAKGEDGSNTMDRISDLPQGILHKILYFLSQEEAVRTSVLSKSWRYIWCTRPNLDLSDKNYFTANKLEFLYVVDKTLQQYCDQRMRLEEFGLRISLGKCLYNESVSLLEKWMPRLTDMGVKESRLSIRSYRYPGCVKPVVFGIESLHRYPGCVKLPPVVFGIESLQELHVERFMLDRNAIQRMVRFEHLKSLSLVVVSIVDETFQTIIASSPLIETLCVKECRGLKKVKLNDLPNLKDFSFSDDLLPQQALFEELCSIEIQYPQSLETVDVSVGNIWFHKGADFRNLKYLSLLGVDSSLEHLSSCTFPSLEFLILKECAGLKGIHLFVDAPKISYFKYNGAYIPSISFATTTSSSREWDSDIYLRHMHKNDASLWLPKIKELLKSLRQSEICLSIRTTFEMNDEDTIQENIQVQDVDGGDEAAVVVESLRLQLRCSLSSLSSFLDAVLCICRPRIIYDYISWIIVEYMWKILTQRESGDQDDRCGKLWQRDLEEVRLEIKETDDEEEWRTITLSEWRSYYEQMDYVSTRFALKWRQTL